jgi:endonuclease/exonuclease/phosphatase family metal-dependent hydrolase
MTLRRLLICGLFFIPCAALRADEPPGQPANPPTATQPADDAGRPPPAAYAGKRVVFWKDAGQYVDKEIVVQGKIVQARNMGNITFLNFDAARSFTAVVHQRNYKNFTTPPERMYEGRTVRIAGIISEFRDKPQIEVIRPDQVTIVPDDAPIPPAPPEAAAAAARAFDGTVTLATFNVLNLFDAHDDPYYLDEGTDPKPEAQLAKLAEMIRRVDADVLALQEVENENVLKQFVDTRLGDMGYRNVVSFPSNDRRGIECSVVTRLPVGPVTSYRFVDFTDGSGSTLRYQRDLLRVRILPPEAPAFDVFVVHFKSKRGGEASSGRVRTAEAAHARQVLDEALTADPMSLFVICGDFNDTFDSPSVKAVRGEGPTALRDFLHDVPKSTVTFNRAPYRSMIDFVFASPAMAERYVKESYHVIPSSPAEGGSDHNPVVVRFRLR